MTPSPAPGLAFVRKIQTAETYGGSAIIVPEQARDKVSESQWEIASVGDLEECKDEECPRPHDPTGDFLNGPVQMWHPCDLAPGDWVLCRKRSVVPSPQPELFIVKQDDVIGRFTVTEGV